MRVKVVREFIDLKNNKKRRKVGEIFDVTNERFKELNNTSFGKVVEEVKEGAKVE